jgi:predicted GNAT family acetyltransferase
MSTSVTDNAASSRYDVVVDGELAGFAAYQKTPELVVFTHTEVDPRFGGQGVGGTLVRQALDDVRSQQLRVLPVCPFVQQWIVRHPDYHDLDYRRPPSRVTD